MALDRLSPRIDHLTQEYVLVQAWKKTASYIRYHNWFSDTLELDRAAVNLPAFLEDLRARLIDPNSWKNDPLRIVPAPKSQDWGVDSATQLWEPFDRKATAAKLRPLAHVSLKDQVVATAVMLCLADRVETIQGDPRDSVTSESKRQKTVSYGNRLFCDVSGSELHHRWGSTRLYRAYFDDHRSFISRPELAATNHPHREGTHLVLVNSDLRQFYDRVRPALLIEKIQGLRRSDDDSQFYDLVQRLFDWQWDKKDAAEVDYYARLSKLENFDNIALPQGLVASGFFANATLLNFDNALANARGVEISPSVRIVDAIRYVDDLRVVLEVSAEAFAPLNVEEVSKAWLGNLLTQHAPGLALHPEKTRAALLTGDERPIVRQSAKMARIQRAVSGGFDAAGGTEILDAVQGLIRSQARYTDRRTKREGWKFLPIADVRDETVSRFAAARFRRTYRLLRPLLLDDVSQPFRDSEDQSAPAVNEIERVRGSRTRSDLDQEARAFALSLIESWISDPSNVRLLRIGLDLWPAKDVLENVFGLLRPFIGRSGRRKAPRRVAWYCMAEIFRAGATETGFVEDNECLPGGININEYREALCVEALRLLEVFPALPWYLKQQVLLFLAAYAPAKVPIVRAGKNPETRHYRELICFLRGDPEKHVAAEFATLSILARRSFLDNADASEIVQKGVTARRLEQIGERDPSFALELLGTRSELISSLSPRIRDDLCLVRPANRDGWRSLAEIVLDGERDGELRNELAVLRFSAGLLKELEARSGEAITPTDVFVQSKDPTALGYSPFSVKIVTNRSSSASSMYRPPEWTSAEESWRFQLGYLLRFILAGREDFTRPVRVPNWKEGTDSYRPAESHWYQRLYGFFSAHSAFGDDWLPISNWIENLLFALLAWPGCPESEARESIRAGRSSVMAALQRRVDELTALQGPTESVLILKLSASQITTVPLPRPLRACVVQTVIPSPGDFPIAGSGGDLTLSGSIIRRKHRNHLSAALAAIERMLKLRETHNNLDGRLDWLIFPELSVHPHDVATHLVPFARAHKTIILAGLTFEQLLSGKPLTNSALWVIPTTSPSHGFQVITRRQGKKHLAPMERAYNQTTLNIEGFRPCQWLVEYRWSSRVIDRPLLLSGAVCYDATDLRLAADLRNRSDVFAIPALNQDVATFDQMALALHYHMFQLVIVANNGCFGGSNAYAPYKESFTKQVFHLHGQPQATMAFLEINDIGAFINRVDHAHSPHSAPPTSIANNPWKFPPAGM